jgi:putative membrane-bound dehydrogenase-like protein
MTRRWGTHPVSKRCTSGTEVPRGLKSILLLAISTLVFLPGCSRPHPPYSAKDALQTFRIEPGFRIENFVAEPDIRSPSDMEWDEDGRIYVVEDPGYPLNTEGKVGRVILLEDTNGDGRPDRRTVFADKLTLPTGIMRWKKGVLVTDAPDVIYFEDTNGDGIADVRRVVLTGFAFTNPQHTVNNPTYGLDNWIYLAHEGPAGAVIFTEKFGDRGSDIRFPDASGTPVLPPARRMLRFRPDTHQIEYLAGSSQFGIGFDAWGHPFTVSNEDHIREEVIAARYLDRNPHLPVGAAMARISDHRPAAEVYPIAENVRVEMLSGVGSFTSACGITVYLGGAFPGLFSLTAEPAQNLVHRDMLSPSGAVYLAKRAREGVEFLASTDSWFRPVNFYIGPDGAIYVLDFYRYAIEHPEWMATETHHSPDLYKGEDRGRIYRITPDAPLALPSKIRLSQASDEELVAHLADPNIWWRRTAQRLLVDRQSERAVTPLLRLFETSKEAVGRLHALWTLDGLHKLDLKLVQKALADPEAGVRENAILLAEPALKQHPELVNALLAMEHDPDSRVRFQLLCTLGSIVSPASTAVQDRLLAQDREDPWMQIAALSASPERAPQLFKTAQSFASQETEAQAAFFRQVTAVIAARRKPEEVRQVLETLVRTATPQSAWWREASLQGLAQGFGGGRGGGGRGGGGRAGRGESGSRENLGQDLLVKLFEGPDKNIRRAALRLLGATGLPANSAARLKTAAATAQQPDADPDLRADSIGMLALEDPAPHEAMLKGLVDPKQPEAVQAAAVRALGRVRGPEIGTFLLDHWRGMTATVRMDAADAMFTDPSRPRQLVEAIKSDRVQPWTLAFRHKRNLVMSRDPALREEARKLLEEKAGDREQVLKRYEAALTMKGNPGKGQEVFDRVCSKCHQLNGKGKEVGPDLATVRNRSPQLILPDIIMPNKSIAQGYESYVVETKSSGIIEGVLGPQTPTTFTIRHEDGKQDIIRREDIIDMRVTNLSAMPADLDKQVSIQQMADLLNYIKSGR